MYEINPSLEMRYCGVPQKVLANSLSPSSIQAAYLSIQTSSKLLVVGPKLLDLLGGPRGKGLGLGSLRPV